MDNSESEEISRLSGCRKPCFYKKYSFMGDKYISSFVTDHFFFSLWAVFNSTLVETKELIYPSEALPCLCLCLCDRSVVDDSHIVKVKEQ